MKIRIKGNTVRYRLVKSEVKQLAERGYVEEMTAFPTTTFRYRVESKEEISALEADFHYAQVTMFIPISEAQIWVHSDRITYKNSFGDLTLILEKDFVCLDHTDEDQSDNYANPNQRC